MEKEILVNAFDETQEDFVPAGGIERIVAEIDEDASDAMWEHVAPEEEETPEVAEEAADDVDVDLEPSKDESLDPMRLYLREMSTVPLLTREDEIRIAKRIERGQHRIYKALSRSFITIEEIERLASELEEGLISPQDVVDVATDPDAEEALEEQREEVRQRLMEQSAEITKVHDKVMKLLAKIEAEPKMSRSAA